MRMGERTVIAQPVFVDNTALALMRYIGYPDTPNTKSVGFRTSVEFFPERFVEFLFNHRCQFTYPVSMVRISHLRKPIGMRPNDSNISRLGIRIVQRNILLYGQIQRLLLFVGRGCWVLPDMFAWDDMLHDAKGTRRHSVL